MLAWIFWGQRGSYRKHEKTVERGGGGARYVRSARCSGTADVRLVNYPESDVPKGAVLAVNGALQSRAAGSAERQ